MHTLFLASNSDMLPKTKLATFTQHVPFWEVLGILALLWPAFWNGFPILYQDLNTYLLSGILPETPFDRPITYGLILRLLTLNTTSLWTAVVLQVALFSFLFFQVCRQLAPDIAKHKIFLLLTLLCATTALPWTVSILIPDIFTSIAFFSLFLILVQEKPASWLYLLYFLSAATHSSHLLIFTGLMPLLMLLRKPLFPQLLQKPLLLRGTLLFFLTGATILTMGSALSKSGHVFFLGSMQNRGLLKPFLDKACPTAHFDLCDAKEQLAGKSGDWFLWVPESPLYRRTNWAGEKKDFKRIIAASFADKEFRVRQIKTIVEAGFRQLIAFGNIDYDVAFVAPEQLHQTIEKYFPKEHKAEETALQQMGKLSKANPVLNRIQNIVVALSVLLVLVAALAGRLRSNPTFTTFITASLLLIVGNAFVCGGFSGVLGRYGARVIWLLPMCAGIALLAGTQGAMRKAQRAPNV
jgi:hypothetical protein